nr:methyltransferase domain-containing protein [Clostridium neonatale]
MNMKNNIKKNSELHFNEIAKNYNNSHDGKFVKCMYDEIIDRVLKKQPKDILDLGCGNGNILSILSDCTDANLFGLDLSKNMIYEAQKKLNDKVQLDIGDSENLPYDDDKFDLVICNASFHHYTNPQKVLKEIKRVLTPSGTLTLGDPTAPFEWYLKILNYFLPKTNSGDYKIYSKNEIYSLLNASGFTPSNWKKINHSAFIIDATLTN